MSKNNLGFRGWYYFRTGWSTYFAFILAAINTLTVTYFLAIENYPSLKSIFPQFHFFDILYPHKCEINESDLLLGGVPD